MSGHCPQSEVLKARLLKSGRDYVCSTALPASAVSVCFMGTFQGQTVVWNMTLATLSHFRLAVSAIPEIEHQSFIGPFIEITEGEEGVFPLKVGLALECIDEPVIKKTIIMIRNYKRLVIGRIEFGASNT